MGGVGTDGHRGGGDSCPEALPCRCASVGDQAVQLLCSRVEVTHVFHVLWFFVDHNYKIGAQVEGWSSKGEETLAEQNRTESQLYDSIADIFLLFSIDKYM